VPATLSAALHKLVLEGAAVKGTGAAALPAAGKGGLAVKMIAGVVLAGVLAGGVALVASGRGDRLASSPAKTDPGQKGLVLECYAGCLARGWLDGPRRETMWEAQGVVGYPDNDFNLYCGWRCIRADGRVVTIATNDYRPLTVCRDEGPADAMPNIFHSAGFGQGSGGVAILGEPIEGGDKGCILAFSASEVFRLWKNKEKGARWWFKRVIGADAGMGTIYTGHATKDNRLVLFTGKGFYAYADGKLSLLLGTEAWQAALPKDARGRTCNATQGLLGGDGYYYLGTYYAGPPLVLRVSPDGKKAEQYVSESKAGRRDGAGIGTGWFCGPHLSASRSNPRFAPPDCIFPSTHDDSDLRRVRDGRVSTLCEDGEWREFKAERGDASGKALNAFRWFVPGPNGTAITSFKVPGPDGRCWIVRGIDYTKPIVGSKAE
jgi:hypothetical protein